MSVEKIACLSAQCNCVNAYLHSKVNSFQYKELSAELVKLVQAKKKEKKVLGVLLKMVYFRLDIEIIPTLLELLAYDEKKPVEETRRVLRLAYYFLSTLAHQHNTSNRYFDPVQARLKTDSTSPLRLMLAVRALSGYIHASANRAITVDMVRKIVKGDELDFVDAQAKQDKKGTKKGERSEDAVVAEGWLEALGFFELRSRLALNIQRSDGPALVKGMLSPLDQVSRNAFEAALAFALLQPEYMAKVIDENMRPLQDRLKVKDEPKTEEKKEDDKKVADKQKAEKGKKDGPTEVVPVHVTDQKQVCKKNHRQKCAFATMLGMISVRDPQMFRKPLHALLVDENLQISLSAIEALLKLPWKEIDVAFETDDFNTSFLFPGMTIVSIIERILTETLENTYKTSKRNTAPIRHKVCRLALMLGENYTRHLHKQNPDVVKQAEDSPHPLLALRKRLVASCSDFKGYIKLKCMQGVVWLVYREDATFLSAFIIEQLDTLPFEIFDQLLLELIRRVQITPFLAGMTLQLIDWVFKRHPSRIHPEVLIGMWKTVMEIEGGKLSVISNILELLSLPQSAATVNLLRVCYWALGEFGCQLSSQFLHPRKIVRKAPSIVTPHDKNLVNEKSGRLGRRGSRSNSVSKDREKSPDKEKDKGAVSASTATLKPLNTSHTLSRTNTNDSSRPSTPSSSSMDSPSASRGSGTGRSSPVQPKAPRFCTRCGLKLMNTAVPARFCHGCGFQVAHTPRADASPDVPRRDLVSPSSPSTPHVLPNASSAVPSTPKEVVVDTPPEEVIVPLNKISRTKGGLEVKAASEKASSLRDQEREAMADVESQLAYALKLQGGETQRERDGRTETGCLAGSPALSLTPCPSFQPPPPNAISLFIKSRALAPALSNPVMNLILLRMESATIQSPWELKIVCLEGLAKIAFLSDFEVKLHLYSFFTLLVEDNGLGISASALPILELLHNIIEMFEASMNGIEPTDEARLAMNNRIAVYCKNLAVESFCPIGLVK